jgi:hypothetical protein
MKRKTGLFSLEYYYSRLADNYTSLKDASHHPVRQSVLSM